MTRILSILKAIGSMLAPYFNFILSPTSKIANCLKNKKGADKKQIIQDLNLFYVFVTFSISVILIILTSSTEFDEILNSNFYYHTIYILFYYSFSRANEIFFAFIEDVHEKLSPPKTNKEPSGLKFFERLPLAARSYFELIFLYGLMYYSIDFLSFKSGSVEKLMSAWEYIYFSGVTITTLGYGDHHPTHYFSQFLSIYEVLNGFGLVIISFTIYVSLSIKNEEHKND